MTEQEYNERVAQLRAHGTRLFRVSFWRQTPKISPDGKLIAAQGTLRTMICRFGVKKGVKGTQENRKEIETRNGLVTVYCMDPGKPHGFRTIKLENIVDVSPAKAPKKAGLPFTLTYNAQTLEYTMRGGPLERSWPAQPSYDAWTAYVLSQPEPTQPFFYAWADEARTNPNTPIERRLK